MRIFSGKKCVNTYVWLQTQAIDQKNRILNTYPVYANYSKTQYIYDLISRNKDKHMYYDTIPGINIRFYAINMLIIRWCVYRIVDMFYQLTYFSGLILFLILFVDTVYSRELFYKLFPRNQWSSSKVKDNYCYSIV